MLEGKKNGHISFFRYSDGTFRPDRLVTEVMMKVGCLAQEGCKRFSGIMYSLSAPNNFLRGITMAQAKKGDKVLINYTGSLEDGTVFDSTLEDVECETIGGGDFFPQIEEALIGMNPGEKKSVVIPAKDAFGEYDTEKVFNVPRSDVPEDLKPEVGDELTLSNDDDEEMEVTVVEVNEESITFDSNHPLAGEDLTFEIELLEIQ